MPRIAPLQLMKCLAILLTPSGGIKSTEGVEKLVALMQKFSKKLVSKCVYVSILKSTDIKLLSDFMDHGGWTLVFQWLQTAIEGENWLLVQDILELLYICPVDVARLKTNSIPKLVKGLSKSSEIQDIQGLASKIVAKWLAIVKGLPLPDPSPSLPAAEESVPVEESEPTVALPPIKITLKKDGNNVVSEVVDESDEAEHKSKVKAKKRDDHERPKSKDSHTRSDKEKNKSDKHKSSHSSSSERHKSSSERHKSSSGEHHRSSSHKSSSSSREKESDRDKDKEKSKSVSSKLYLQKKEKEREKERLREREKREKEKEKKEKEKLTKEEKDRQIETEQAALARLMIPSINKLGKIPKKTDKARSEEKSAEDDKKEKRPAVDAPKKPYSFSIEKRQPSDQKPRTVKVFNAKSRSTGLEEESTKPPPVKSKTSTATLPKQNPVPERKPLKRASPLKETSSEKKSKVEPVSPVSPSLPSLPLQTSVEKVSPDKAKPVSKPKVMVLQESDVFSDALNDATILKESKKKKRKLSKDEDKKEATKENKNVPSVMTSPTQKQEDPKPTFKFYRDTLDSTLEESKKRDEIEKKSEAELSPDQSEVSSPTHEEESLPNPTSSPRSEKIEKCNINVVSQPPNQPIKGVLTYIKAAKRPKKSVQWRQSEELEDVFYFELDETERCNVSRPFRDMRLMEREHEREHFIIARKLSHEDTQEEKIPWTSPPPIDLPKSAIVPGQKSQEKDIQFARQMQIEPVIYYNKLMIPPTPAEPDFEVHVTTDPVIIPLDDVDNPDIIDFSHQPWPEPKQSEDDLNKVENLPVDNADNMMYMTPEAMQAMSMVSNMFSGNMPPSGQFPPNWMPPSGDIPPNAVPPMGIMPPYPPGMGPPGMVPPGNMVPNGPPGPLGPGGPPGLMGPGGPPMVPGMFGPPMNMMMNNPMNAPFPPVGPPGMFGPGPGFNGPPGQWFGPNGTNEPSGPPINDGPPKNDAYKGNDSYKSSSKQSHRSKSSGGSWHRGEREPTRSKSERDRPYSDRPSSGRGRDRSSTPCKYKNYCKNRDCPFMHPSR